MLKTIILLLALTITSRTIFAQDKDYIIPFTLTDYNNLSIQAILNKKDTVHLMFHTASNSLILTEEAVRKTQTLIFEGADSVSSWGGGGNASRYSKGNTLQIGALHWENLPIWEDKNSGRNTDGKFGLDLFKDKVVEIDFDKSFIVIHTFLPEKHKNYEKLKLVHENANLFVVASCKIGNILYKNRFLIHSGYSGAVLLDDQFVRENKIGEQLKIVDEKELKDSFGHVLKTQKAILPTLVIGREELNEVPVGFFQGALGRQRVSIFGGDILKRFNIIIDAQREYIYLQPNGWAKVGYMG